MVHRNHPARSASKKPRRRLLFNTAIDGPRKHGFPKRFRSLAYARASLDRFHSIIRTVKPVEHPCRLSENPKLRNRTSSWIDWCVGRQGRQSAVAQAAWQSNRRDTVPDHTQPSGAQRFPEGRHVPLRIIGGNHGNTESNTGCNRADGHRIKRRRSIAPGQ